MGNHIISPRTPGNLLRSCRINSSYGYLSKYGKGPSFSKEIQGDLVDKDPYLLELTRYVHLNPVRAKVAERPEEYAWSSYAGYIRKRKRLGWVEYGWILSQFGSDEAAAGKMYRKFVERGMEEKGESPLSDVVGQAVLGGEEMLGKVKSLVRGKAIWQDVVERKRFKDAPGAEEIISAVESLWGWTRG
jgi:hypothetical protein